MQDLLTIILLGIIEGLTEFIPVSSTGHLILLSELLGFTGEGSAAFKISIQLGAILAILIAYWRRFWNVGHGLMRADRDSVMFTRNILIAFLPAMVIGAFAYEGIRVLLQSPVTVAIALILGGLAILAIERMVKHVTVESVEAMPLKTAIGIGIVQCLAMVPGVSRSGASIMGALLMGVERKTAAEFSFFLAVPTMIGATVYALWKDRDVLTFDDLNAIAIGFTVAFLVALLVVKAFVAIVGRFGFAPFAWYRIVIGSVALVWLLAR
ncbi:undecaprenyl-diphosphate phosphatase [Sphingomonas sp. AX6]|uniref:undecaprenyl-diphosphate phosphatase n=1 Tax=Sphingomonas sp. AX6 TaxID=2653171 RepID=UPI0012F11253|nr:undecaprenyl-diphosphate phosphatase [Sphingomonas sp. AX6]VXC60463.1 Undecaprenyl-diphosphatase [Sphingomonas sp. AX6]